MDLLRRFWPDVASAAALLFGLWRGRPLWPVALLALAAWCCLLAVRVRLPGGRQPFTAWMQLMIAAFFLALRFVVPRLPGSGPGGMAFVAGLFLTALGVLVRKVRHFPWEWVDPRRNVSSEERRRRRVLSYWLYAIGAGVMAGGVLLPGRWPLLVLALAGVTVLAAGIAATGGPRPRYPWGRAPAP